jgi:predicted RNase H-like nuclease (RuvC/YqgF family)
VKKWRQKAPRDRQEDTVANIVAGMASLSSPNPRKIAKRSRGDSEAPQAELGRIRRENEKEIEEIKNYWRRRNAELRTQLEEKEAENERLRHQLMDSSGDG